MLIVWNVLRRLCQHFHKPWHHFFDDSVTNSEPYPTTAAFKQELIAFHKTLSFQNISTDRVTSATNNLNQKKDFKNKWCTYQNNPRIPETFKTWNIQTMFPFTRIKKIVLVFRSVNRILIALLDVPKWSSLG